MRNLTVDDELVTGEVRMCKFRWQPTSIDDFSALLWEEWEFRAIHSK